MLSNGWSLSEINNADYALLMELFNAEEVKQEEKVDPMAFFGTFMSPADMAKVNGKTLED